MGLNSIPCWVPLPKLWDAASQPLSDRVAVAGRGRRRLVTRRCRLPRASASPRRLAASKAAKGSDSARGRGTSSSRPRPATWDGPHLLGRGGQEKEVEVALSGTDRLANWPQKPFFQQVVRRLQPAPRGERDSFSQSDAPFCSKAENPVEKTTGPCLERRNLPHMAMSPHGRDLAALPFSARPMIDACGGAGLKNGGVLLGAIGWPRSPVFRWLSAAG